ncbi:hydantoinase/oxoprolinase family protein [Candidatus Acetothermia bacterium]|nr:hydantoinase/oxoprolinase family protein [Candidatus Acetothermia bacterium]MBI3643637.1 hydantoinase/oxoprolinase family protein [Candidatus Acetothermia bacterium]
MTLHVGIDVGGTFTDIVVFDTKTCDLRFLKVPSTRPPEIGVLNGLHAIESSLKLPVKEITRLIHGSTVATNALLEGRWAKTALITTQGFRDVLEIGRQNRPSLYDFKVERPAPLVPRALRFQVAERLDYEGKVIRELDEMLVKNLAPHLQHCEAVAVCFLFSYLNPAHEQQVKRVLERELRIPVVCSSEVLPEYREYERTSTTVMSAALLPVVGAYIEKLSHDVKAIEIPAELEIMQSNGGLASANSAAHHAENLLYSGPAGGVAGSQFVGELAGFPNLITFDMGGTSTDVSLISSGHALKRMESELAGHRIRVPMVDIHSVGAGGGSIGWIDSGGALQVGPQSAGSDPGPAGYGQGDQPTVTDAQLVLGRFDRENALGGRRLDLERARSVIEKKIAKPFKMSIEEAALGILEIADACMERAIRVITVERGHDPRDYALLAFGGGGPLHAVSVAEKLGTKKILVPVTAGVLSALGMITADIRRDLVQSILKPTSEIRPDGIARAFQALKEEAIKSLNSQELLLRPLVEIRYRGQAYELLIEMPAEKIWDAKLSPGDLANLEVLFHREHEELYGYALEKHPAEIVSVRLEATIQTQKPQLPAYPVSHGRTPKPRAYRDVLFSKAHREKCPIFAREILKAGHELRGPVIIEGPESTVLIPPDWLGRVDEWGNLILEQA